MFRYLVTDILFFVSINLITPEELKVLQAELLELLEGMERFVAKGCYDDTGNEIYVYLSNINLDTSYCYLGGQNYHLSMLKAFTLNSITSFDVETFHRLKNWMSSLKRSSTLISVSGEKERVRFFNDQRCLVQGNDRHDLSGYLSNRVCHLSLHFHDPFSRSFQVTPREEEQQEYVEVFGTPVHG